MLQLMMNALDNIVSAENHKGAISWAADCYDLLLACPWISPDKVGQLAKDAGLMPQFRIMAELLRRVIPGAFDGFSQEDSLTRADIRACSRLMKHYRYFSVPVEEIRDYSMLRHIAFRAKYSYYGCAFYMLDKSVWSCLCRYPAFLRKYWGIESFGELPAIIGGKIREKHGDRGEGSDAEGDL